MEHFPATKVFLKLPDVPTSDRRSNRVNMKFHIYSRQTHVGFINNTHRPAAAPIVYLR